MIPCYIVQDWPLYVFRLPFATYCPPVIRRFYAKRHSHYASFALRSTLAVIHPMHALRRNQALSLGDSTLSICASILYVLPKNPTQNILSHLPHPEPSCSRLLFSPLVTKNLHLVTSIPIWFVLLCQWASPTPNARLP